MHANPKRLPLDETLTLTPADPTSAPAALDLEASGSSSSRRRRRTTKLVGWAAAVLAVLTIGFSLGGTPASADTVVAGTRFLSSTAQCGSWLSISAQGPTAWGPNNYVQVVLYDYSAGAWVYGPWHQMGNYSMQLENDFRFGHTGYYYPTLHYAVLTTAGWNYGWETFPTFGQRDNFGTVRQSQTCYINSVG